VQYLKDQQIPFEYLIDMDPNGSAETNAQQLDTRVQQIAQQFGVKSVHFIGHSKGATDARYLLSSAYTSSEFGDPYGEPLSYQVKSLYSLGTPSKGTILSDLVLRGRDVHILKGGVPDYRAVNGGQLPDFLRTALITTALADTANQPYAAFINLNALFSSNPIPDPAKTKSLNPIGDALFLQSLVGMADFNNAVLKRPGTCYYASAGDADLNRDGVLTPDESEGMVPAADKIPEYALYKIPTATYQFIGRIRSISLNWNGSAWTASGQISNDGDLKPNDMCSRMDSVLCAECGFVTLQTYPTPDNPTWPANHTAMKSPPVIRRILDQIRADFPLGGTAKGCTP
jgi:hypothetical protein